MRNLSELLFQVVLISILHIASVNAGELSWRTSLGGNWTAADGAAHLFRHGHLDADHFVVSDDKLLRKPDSTTDRTTIPANTRLKAPQEQKIRSEGKLYHLLYWGDSENSDFSILAIFPDGSPDPIDVADVKGDRETYFGSPLSVGNEDIFAITNAHLSAGEDYHAESMFRLRRGRLSLVARVFTGSRGLCPRYAEVLQWKVKPSAGSAMATLIAAVDLVTNPKDGLPSDCKEQSKTKESHHLFEESYQWDATKDHYVDSGGSFKAWAELEEKLDQQTETWLKRAGG